MKTTLLIVIVAVVAGAAVLGFGGVCNPGLSYFDGLESCYAGDAADEPAAPTEATPPVTTPQ